MTVSFKSAFLPLALTAALSFGAVGTASADALTENFDNGVPADWTIVNNSIPEGGTSWFQGSVEQFPAQAGAGNSFIAANFNSGSGLANLSTWLILPTSTYVNGDTLSFYTRTVAESLFPDNLEVRFSTVGGTDVGTDDSSVGTFSTLLLSVNPDETFGTYPEAWTQYSLTLSGLTGATNGAFAFRYVVAEGGTDGIKSNYVALDSLNITSTATGISPVPEMETYLMMAAGLGLVGWMRKRKARAA